MRRILSAAPDIALGLTYVLTWVSPAAQSRLPYLLQVMLLEFLVIHSSAFMGTIALADWPRVGRAGAILGLGAFYSIFAGGFALAFREWFIFLAFWSLTLNRLTGVIFGTTPSGEDEDALAIGWAVSVFLYLMWAFATTLLPVPSFAITPGAGGSGLPGSGLWIDEPQRMVAFGTAYFLSQGFLELRPWALARTLRGA